MPPVPRACERSLVAALLTLLSVLLLAVAPAHASVSSTTDPEDGYDSTNSDGFAFKQSLDVRKLTWDSDTQPGKVLLSIEADYAPPSADAPDGARMEGAVFIDTNRDGAADYALDISASPYGPSYHPQTTSSAGEVRYRLRQVTSDASCQIYQNDTSGDYSAHPDNDPTTYLSAPATYR